MRNYFCGWYFRCQSDRQTLALIPSVHRTGKSSFCAIQLITDTQSFHVPFPCALPSAAPWFGQSMSILPVGFATDLRKTVSRYWSWTLPMPLLNMNSDSPRIKR